MSDLAIIQALADIAQAVGEVNVNFDAQTILDSLKTVDGAGSGLDADLLDGEHKRASVGGTLADASTPVSGIVGITMYYKSSSGVGFPTNYGGVLQMWLGADRAMQLYSQLGVTPGLWFRSGTNTDWGEWRRVGWADQSSFRATVGGGQVISGHTKILYGTVVFDRHSDYNASTSEFTAPEDGVYAVRASLHCNDKLFKDEDVVALHLYKNGARDAVLDRQTLPGDFNRNVHLTGGVNVLLSAGDKLTIYAYEYRTGPDDLVVYNGSNKDHYSRWCVHKVS